jgi:hypothetical protein
MGILECVKPRRSNRGLRLPFAALVLAVIALLLELLK